MTPQGDKKRPPRKPAKPKAAAPKAKPSALERLLANHGGPLWIEHTHCLIGAVTRGGEIVEANAALKRLMPPGGSCPAPLLSLYVEPNHDRLKALLERAFTPEGAAPEWQTFHIATPDSPLPESYKCGFLPLPRGRALLYAEPLPPLDAQTAEEYFRVNTELATMTRDLQKARRDLERYSRELEESRTRIMELATTDELTGLPNRRSMQARLNDEVIRAARYGTPLSVLVVDLDHFKTINDTHGHQVGDRVLRHVGKTMSEALRTCDVVGRFGGEEFLVILPQTALDEAAQVAERLRDTLERKPSVIHFSLVITVTMSAGVAALRVRDGDTIDHLLERADKALYAAKDKGRNRIEREAPAASKKA